MMKPFFLVLLTAALAIPAPVQAQKQPPEPPDLTAGGQRDAKSADFNLGPTGARGWVFGWHEASYNSRQILITEVAGDSPADGVLKIGDVVLGVSGKAFEADARRAFGNAIAPAEVTGKLALQIWRAGETMTVTVPLKVLGDYSDTWPYSCQKSETILKQGCEWIDSLELKANIQSDVNVLTLLASGDEKYLPKVKRYARLVSPPDLDLNFETVGGYPSWHWGYRLIFLCEYHLTTGDESVLPAIRKYAHEISRGQSAVGTWGHRMAEPKFNGGNLHGRLGGYGAVNAAGLPCFVGMTMARELCGITDDTELNDGIERSRRFFSFFAGRGSIPYGFHDPRLADHDDNGKNSMGAVAFDVLGDNFETRQFARWALASYDSRELGHTGNFFSYLWGPAGVARIGPEAASAFLREQQWYYDLARDHRGRMHYQGQAGQGNQNYSRWDCTGVYLLAYALPKAKTWFTGRGVKPDNVIGGQGIADSLEAGRGYTIWDRGHAHYSAKSVDELLADLKSWSALTRQRAAKALAEKPGDHVPRLIPMLEGSDPNAQFGACQAIQATVDPNAAAVDPLITLLESGDLWLRINAGKALVAIGGDEARVAAPKLLELLANEDPEADPLMVESRYIGECLFQKAGRSRGGPARAGLLSESIEGADPGQLLTAAKYILTHPNGGARNSVTSLYQTMTPAQLKPIMPEIIASIEKPGWSVMFSNGVRENGLAFLAENHIAEGLDQLVNLIDPDNPRGNEGYWFAPRVVKNFQHYKGAAKPYLPKLKEYAERYKSNRMLEKNTRFHEQMEKTLEMIENDPNPPELIGWKDL